MNLGEDLESTLNLLFFKDNIKFDHHIRLRESTQVILTPHFHPKN
jgi:hypothetical protein